jgi:hypothetical protein
MKTMVAIHYIILYNNIEDYISLKRSMLKLLGIGDNVCDKYRHLRKMFPGGQALNIDVYAKKECHFETSLHIKYLNVIFS